MEAVSITVLVAVGAAVATLALVLLVVFARSRRRGRDDQDRVLELVDRHAQQRRDRRGRQLAGGDEAQVADISREGAEDR